MRYAFAPRLVRLSSPVPQFVATDRYRGGLGKAVAISYVVDFMIGDRIYRRKTDALSAIQEVRDRVNSNGVVTPEDDEFLRDLIALHPDADAKVAVGIERFEVRRNLGNTDGFWIIRTDATETDFSFIRCLFGASQEMKVRSAMRHAVIDQVQAARDRAFQDSPKLECPVSGDSINAETCHMDHENPSFVGLADRFAASRGGYDSIGTVAMDGQIGRRFVDPSLEADWQAYHRANASLRPVSRRANLSILRRGIKRN